MAFMPLMLAVLVAAMALGVNAIGGRNDIEPHIYTTELTCSQHARLTATESPLSWSDAATLRQVSTASARLTMTMRYGRHCTIGMT